MGCRVRLGTVLIALLLAAACGGGGGGGGGSADGGGNFAIVRGRVIDVVGDGITTAPGSVGGIRVEARDFDRTVAVDTTDAAGNFVLEFAGAGEFELVFLDDDFTLSLRLVLSPGSVVTLAVELRPVEDEVVVVDEGNGEDGPLRCQTGSLVIDDGDRDLVIDGRGEDCVRAEGNCNLQIVGRTVSLVDCEACIRTAGGADVVVIATSGSFNCEARQEGIRAAGNSRVEVDVVEHVDITAGELGIRADGNAEVVLAAPGTCRLEGSGPLQVQGSAVVDTAACGDLDLIGD